MVTFLKKETANPIAKYTGKKTKNCINVLGLGWGNKF
jgi:hypothetical protein